MDPIILSLALLAAVMVIIVLACNRNELAESNRRLQLRLQDQQDNYDELNRYNDQLVGRIKHQGIDIDRLRSERDEAQFELEKTGANYREAIRRAKFAEGESERHKAMLREDARQLFEGGNTIAEQITQIRQQVAQIEYLSGKLIKAAAIIEALEKETQYKYAVQMWPPQADNEGAFTYTGRIHLN